MSKTFLCFAGSCRAEIIEPLYNILTNTGINIWYDYRCMMFGDDYFSKNFLEGICMSKYAVIVFTEDIFKRPCAISELDYIKNLNETGKIKIFPIIYNIPMDKIPIKYKTWISKFIYNEYNNLTVENIAITALQIASKLFSEILTDLNVESLKSQIIHNKDIYETQISNFCESIESGDHLIKATALYLLFQYHCSRYFPNKDVKSVNNNLRYLLRQLISCNPIITTSILNCMESLIRLNY